MYIIIINVAKPIYLKLIIEIISNIDLLIDEMHMEYNKYFKFKNSWGCRPRTQITCASFLGSEEPSLKLLCLAELQRMNSDPIVSIRNRPSF